MWALEIAAVCCLVDVDSVCIARFTSWEESSRLDVPWQRSNSQALPTALAAL